MPDQVGHHLCSRASAKGQGLGAGGRPVAGRRRRARWQAPPPNTAQRVEGCVGWR